MSEMYGRRRVLIFTYTMCKVYVCLIFSAHDLLSQSQFGKPSRAHHKTSNPSSVLCLNREILLAKLRLQIIFRFLAGAFGSSPLTNAGGVLAE